ncbi:hypothetical protein HYFRA_00003575 [Hymenoscyphus fraxineus]|uniref:Uncharacterized protein n=1 Tax=Hymenoscyphus fraxineus TaxID=746836 RepID=A0A9N9KTU7_9HELO|nr:hypothetical protein HYFRA_00003575 [Hymenoscyphus fraxineus]
MPLSKEHIYLKKLRGLVSAESWDHNFVKGQGTYRGFIKMRGSEDNTWINKPDISGDSGFYFPDRGMNISGIMLLENATLETICHYGVRYDIDPVFFAQHKCGSRSGCTWTARWSTTHPSTGNRR